MKTQFARIIDAFIAFVWIAIFSPIAQGQTAEEYFMLANNAYASGDFAKAKENYSNAEKIKPSAEISYNLANTNAKLGKKGEALVNYLRALHQNPRMREASANLETFAKDNSLETPEDIFSLPLFSELSESEWAGLAFAFFWIVVLLVIVPPLYGVRAMSAIFMAILCFAFLVFASLAVSDWNSYSNVAVSLGNDVKLRVSPVENAPAAALAQEGQIGSVEKKHGDFLKVRTKSGKSGWVKSDEFAPVVEQ